MDSEGERACSGNLRLGCGLFSTGGGEQSSGGRQGEGGGEGRGGGNWRRKEGRKRGGGGGWGEQAQHTHTHTRIPSSSSSSLLLLLSEAVLSGSSMPYALSGAVSASDALGVGVYVPSRLLSTDRVCRCGLCGRVSGWLICVHVVVQGETSGEQKMERGRSG